MMSHGIMALGLMAGVAYGATTTTLSPIVAPTADPSTALSDSIALQYGDASSSLVNVNLSMVHPAVVLENIAAIVAVDCSATSVAVTFNSSDALAAAAADWTSASNIVLVTNHLGDCDAENERGFFIASSVSTDEDALVINVSAEKSDVKGTAASTEINFSSLPVANSKREIVVNDTGVTISGTVSLPSSLTLYEYAPYVTAIADSGDISVSVGISGYLKYTILDGTLDAFYVDIDSTLSADLALELDVGAAYDNTFTYSPATLEYSLIDVPGIITLGPALAFDIGVELSAGGAVTVKGEVGAGIVDGNIHLDFVNQSKTSTSGWTPTYNAELNITEAASLNVNPFIDLTIELEFELLSGALDLSGGVTAKPKFNNEFVLTAGQTVSTTGVSQTTGGTCSSGVEIISEFDFSVLAFVTQWWSETVYSVAVPIADKCYSWA